MGFQLSKHLFLLEKEEYHSLIITLNIEQQAIIKAIAMKKHMKIDKPLYLFLIGGDGTGKIFTEKVIF